MFFHNFDCRSYVYADLARSLEKVGPLFSVPFALCVVGCDRIATVWDRASQRMSEHSDLQEKYRCSVLLLHSKELFTVAFEMVFSKNEDRVVVVNDVEEQEMIKEKISEVDLAKQILKKPRYFYLNNEYGLDFFFIKHDSSFTIENDVRFCSPQRHQDFRRVIHQALFNSSALKAMRARELQRVQGSVEQGIDGEKLFSFLNNMVRQSAFDLVINPRNHPDLLDVQRQMYTKKLEISFSYIDPYQTLEEIYEKTVNIPDTLAYVMVNDQKASFEKKDVMLVIWQLWNAAHANTFSVLQNAVFHCLDDQSLQDEINTDVRQLLSENDELMSVYRQSSVIKTILAESLRYRTQGRCAVREGGATVDLNDYNYLEDLVGESPEKYNPKRHGDVKSFLSLPWLPFGHGSSMCQGSQQALVVISFFLGELFSHYWVEKVNDPTEGITSYAFHLRSQS